MAYGECLALVPPINSVSSFAWSSSFMGAQPIFLFERCKFISFLNTLQKIECLGGGLYI